MAKPNGTPMTRMQALIVKEIERRAMCSTVFSIAKGARTAQAGTAGMHTEDSLFVALWQELEHRILHVLPVGVVLLVLRRRQHDARVRRRAPAVRQPAMPGAAFAAVAGAGLAQVTGRGVRWPLPLCAGGCRNARRPWPGPRASCFQKQAHCLGADVLLLTSTSCHRMQSKRSKQ